MEIKWIGEVLLSNILLLQSHTMPQLQVVPEVRYKLFVKIYKVVNMKPILNIVMRLRKIVKLLAKSKLNS